MRTFELKLIVNSTVGTNACFIIDHYIIACVRESYDLHALVAIEGLLFCELLGLVSSSVDILLDTY